MTKGAGKTDWDPAHYGQFGDLRLQPALDLFSAVGEAPAGEVVDLGCGAGVMGPALRDRYQYERIIGVDLSPAMLEQAKSAHGYDRLEKGDIAFWEPDRRPALIFSNAALQWIGDHQRLMARLAKALLPGGWLAVQMPAQESAPSHAAWREITQTDAKHAPILSPREYLEILSPLGAARVWETVYHQRLAPCDDGHPVRQFTESTYGRGFLEGLSTAEQRDVTLAYDAQMSEAYPLEDDGSVLFPFRRLFFVFQKPETDPLSRL